MKKNLKFGIRENITSLRLGDVASTVWGRPENEWHYVGNKRLEFETREEAEAYIAANLRTEFRYSHRWGECSVSFEPRRISAPYAKHKRNHRKNLPLIP